MQQYYKPTSTLFAWSSEYPESELRNFTKYYTKECQFLDSYISDFPLRELYPIYFKYISNFQLKIQNNKSFLSPIEQQIVNTRRLQGVHVSCDDLEFFKARIYQYYHTPENQTVDPIAHVNPELQKHLSLHIMKFAPCLAMIKSSATYYSNFVPIRKHVKVLCLSELRHQLSSPIHVNQAQYASAYPTIFKCKYLFEAQNEPEKKEININELKKQLRLFIAKKPNSLKYEIINLSRAPPEKYHNAVQSFYSIITNHLDRLPDVMRLLDECAPHAGASLHRVQQMYESCYDRNRHRHVQNNRQRLRDYKMSAQGLFGIDLRLPPAVNDTFARLTRMDDNGTFTHLMEMINQFQKNFEEATKPLRENPAKMETVSRTLIAFLMFMIVCFTVQDNLARLFAGLFVLNSLPRAYVNNFVASVYDTISSIADSYKVQTPEEAEQFLQDHGVLPPNNNRYDLTAQGDKDSSKENLIESFGKYLFTLFIDKDVTEIKLEDLRVKRITNLSRIMSSSKTILEFLESLILNLRDIVSDLFFGTENYHDAYRAIDVRIPAWITEVEKLEFLVNDSGKICSPLLALSQYEQKVRLVNLLREGDDLFKLVSAMYVKPEKIVRFLELKLNRVKDLVKGISATLVGMKSKHEPFSIYIWGKPGIGKSLMVDFILKDLYAANDEEYDFVRDKYMKSDITPFWEGYDHQKVYVIDDIFQTISEEIRTTQMNEVMHIGSRCPFPLNMADCANKGCVNFSSETLVVTANNKISSNEVEKVITTYEAFKRRFKFFIEAKLKPDYIDQNNRFNINLAAGDTFVRNAYQFTVETHQTTNTYDWDELIFLLADVRIEHVARQRELDLTLENSKSSTRAKYILHRQKKYGEKPQELPPKVDVEPQLMNNYLNLFPANSTAEMKNTIVSFFQSDDRKAEGFLEYAFIRGFSQAANYLVNGFVRNSIFSFNLHPHLNINSETPTKIIEREKYRWAADPTTLAYKFGAPTQVRKGDVSYTQEISDLVDIEKMKVEANMKIQPNQSPQQFSVDVQLLSEFFAGLHTERRMVFNLREFQMVYEGIRAASTEQNHRFSTDQYAMICLERSDLGLIRAWLTSPNVHLDVERLETDYGKFLYKEIIDRLRSMSHMVPIDCEVKTFRSTVKAYLTHPVFVALGIATTVFSAYHLYSHFQKTNTPLQPFPTSWRDFTSEAGASTSGDSVTRRPRRMAFKKHTRYAENRPNKPTASTPHPHQCPQCLRYYAHFHAFDHVKTHNHVPFVCPYSDCNDFYLLNPDRANDNPPYRCFAVNESEVEFIDEPLFKDPLLSEAERDPQCMVAMQILNDHVVTVHVVGSGTMRGIIVAGRTMIMPYHAFHCLDMIDNAEIVIEGRLLPQFTMTLTAENYIVDRKKDIIMFNLPDKIPLKKNVIDYFCNEKEYLNQIDSAYVIKYMGKNTSLYQHITDLRMDKEIDYKVINAKDEREQWYVPHGYVYTADTGPGDCGSPIVVCHKGMTRKVLGMHVAGGKGTGALALVTPEQLRDMQNRLNERSAQFSKEEISREYCEDFFDCVDFPLHPQDNIEILGLIPNSKIVYQPSTTAILPSALNNEIFPCATQPALLCRKGKLDPLRNDLIKQCTKEVLFNEEYLNLAVTDLSNTINSLKSPYKNRKQLNLHENVNGIDGDDYICSLNFQSSVGFPWPQKLKKLGSKKERYFTGEIGNKVPLPQITQALEEMEEKCSKRIVPFVMFHDSLKDERRPLAKVLAGKTRIFSVPPVEFTLLVRKHFLNFVAHLMHNHITSEVSVGLNVHSDEWKIFFEHAKSVGHNWIAGDYGGYDKRLPYQVCMAALRVVDEFYADQCGVIRRSLGEAMFSSVHFANRVVYQTHHGMPSGVPITAVFNSVVNSLLFRLAFIEISVQAGKSLPETLGFLREGIAIRTYGDDHLVRVHRDCDYFNMVTVSKYFESKGLEYTTTTKAEVEEKYVAEEDLSYLKRKFVYRNGICCAPLEMQSIQEMINWIRKCDDPILALEQNIEAALLEMTHYSRKEWNYFYNRLRDACRTKSIALKTYSFDLCQQILRSGDTANYGVILLEDQTLQVKSTAAIGSEPSRTFLGPTNTGNGSLNIGCKVSEAKVDRSPSVSSVAKNQILKSKYNLIAQSAHETDENIHMTFMGSVSEIPKYSTEDGEFPQGMNLRFEYLARNSYCTFYRLIKITNCTTTPVGQSQSNLTWCGLTFVKEFEDNLSEVYSLNRCQYIPPPECSLYFKRDTGYEELSVFSMYVMPPSEFTTGYDEGGEGPNFMFTYSYTLGDQNVFYLSKRLFPTLLPKQSIIFIPQYHTNSYGWYTFRINELMTFDNIDDIIYHNDTEHDQGISEDKISPDKIPSFKTTVDDIFFHYAFTQGEQEVELVDLLTLKPPLKEMLAVFTYDSETPTRFYYRLNFVSKASPLGEFYSNAPQVDKIYDELEDITPTDDEVNDFNERLLKLSISRAEKLSYDDPEGLQLQNIVDDSELLEEPSERKINYQALVDAGTSSSPQNTICMLKCSPKNQTSMTNRQSKKSVLIFMLNLNSTPKLKTLLPKLKLLLNSWTLLIKTKLLSHLANLV
nr:TPA_asm: hypothetical protein [Dugejap virus 3]